MTRTVTNADVKKYEKMVTMYLRDSVTKNWKEATLHNNDDEITLGNTGWSMADMRQYLYSEVVVALQKYNPDYRTKENRPVKESTFVFRHLYNRIGQTMKRFTSKKYGYGLWPQQLDHLLGENILED